MALFYALVLLNNEEEEKKNESKNMYVSRKIDKCNFSSNFWRHAAFFWGRENF